MKKKRKEPKRKPAEKIADICLILGLLLLILGALPILSILGTAVYYLFLILVTMLTFFLILLSEDFRKLFAKGPRQLSEFTEFIKYAPFILGVATALSVVAVVIYAKSKDKFRRSERILAGVVLAILSVASIIFLPKI